MKNKTKQNKPIKWDEHMVMAVVVASAFCVLIFLAGFISSTGKATYTGLIDSENTIQMIGSSSHTLVVNGTGRMKCTFACSNVGMYSMLSFTIEDQVKSYAENDQITNAEQFRCLCIVN